MLYTARDLKRITITESNIVLPFKMLLNTSDSDIPYFSTVDETVKGSELVQTVSGVCASTIVSTLEKVGLISFDDLEARTNEQ